MTLFVRRFLSQGHLIDSGFLTGMMYPMIEEGDVGAVPALIGGENDWE